MLTSIRGLIAATVFASAAVAAVPAYADDETAPPAEFTVTGSVSLVSDYRFRAVSQTSGDPAIQGTINLNHSSGFYVGAWSSSIELSNVGLDPVFGGHELDLYGGWTGEVSSGLTADVGLLYYAYPGGHVGTAEFFEPYASLTTTLGPAKAKLGATYAWKQDALFGDDNLYLYSNLDVGIPNTPITLSGHLGYQDGSLAADFWSSADKTTWDWSIGASAAVLGKGTIGVAYVGNGSPSISGLTDDTVVGTLSFSF